MLDEKMLRMSKVKVQVNTNFKQQPQMASVPEEEEFALDELVLGA